MAVLVGSIVAVAVVRNFAGVVIGTGCVLADFSWSASDDIGIGSKELEDAIQKNICLG